MAQQPLDLRAVRLCALSGDVTACLHVRRHADLFVCPLLMLRLLVPSSRASVPAANRRQCAAELRYAQLNGAAQPLRPAPRPLRHVSPEGWASGEEEEEEEEEGTRTASSAAVNKSHE